MFDRISMGNPKHRRGRRRLKSLAFLPNAVTVGNLLCGFAAIHFAIRSVYESGSGAVPIAPRALPPEVLDLALPPFICVGAGLIFVGMVLDTLDGVLARVTRAPTDFGGQLDSLADVVTFGVAPATLILALLTNHLGGDTIPSPLSYGVFGRFVWVSAAVYVACAALRLARFNVEHAESEKTYRTFQGLPSPGAASIIAALIIFQLQDFGAPFRDAIVHAMPLVALATGGLMVSRIPYAKYHRAFLVGRKPFGQFITFVFIFAAFWLYKSPTAVLLSVWYCLSGPVQLVLRAFRRKPETLINVRDAASDEAKRSA